MEAFGKLPGRSPRCSASSVSTLTTIDEDRMVVVVEDSRDDAAMPYVSSPTKDDMVVRAKTQVKQMRRPKLAAERRRASSGPKASPWLPANDEIERAGSAFLEAVGPTLQEHERRDAGHDRKPSRAAAVRRKTHRRGKTVDWSCLERNMGQLPLSPSSRPSQAPRQRTTTM